MSREHRSEDAIISPEEESKLLHVLHARHASQLKGRRFKISYSYKHPAAETTLLLYSDDESFYYPVEGKILCKANELSPRDGVMLVLDYMAAYFDSFFKEDEQLYLPIEWSEHTFDNYHLMLRGQIRNLKYERMADEIVASGE